MKYIALMGILLVGLSACGGEGSAAELDDQNQGLEQRVAELEDIVAQLAGLPDSSPLSPREQWVIGTMLELKITYSDASNLWSAQASQQGAQRELLLVQAAIDGLMAHLQVSEIIPYDACRSISEECPPVILGGEPIFISPSYMESSGTQRSYGWDSFGYVFLVEDQTLAHAIAVDLGTIRQALDAAIADNGFTSVASVNGCTDFGETGGCDVDPGPGILYLYPEYISAQTRGRRSYRWDSTGVVYLAEHLEFSPETIGASTELQTIQAAMDAAIADNGFTSVATATGCTDFSETGGCNVNAGLDDIYLYPTYMRTATAGEERSYGWDSTGLVYVVDSQVPVANQAPLTELEMVQAAMDAAIADNGFTSVATASTISDFSWVGGGDLDPAAVATQYLYPDYITFKTADDGQTYSWDSTGLVSTP